MFPSTPATDRAMSSHTITPPPDAGDAPAPARPIRARGRRRVRTPAAASSPVVRSLRRRVVFFALKLSAGTIAALVVLALFGILVFVRRGDVLAGRRAAQAELALLLEPGERVEREVFVSQRHWYHYFREMHGVLAATDRRLLYVGVEPAPLLPRREFEPQAFEEQVYAWDTLTAVAPERVFFNTARGAVVRGREGSQTLAVSGPQDERLLSVATYVAARVRTVREQLERERQARIAAEIEARKPKFHTVQRGEALISIADRYGVTPEQLRAWNQLPDERIRAGQVIMVKPQT